MSRRRSFDGQDGSGELEQPLRPAIPATLIVLALVLGVERMTMSGRFELPSRLRPMAFVGGLCLIASAVAFVLIKHGAQGDVPSRPPVMVLASLGICLLALGLACARVETDRQAGQLLERSSMLDWEFTVLSDPVPSDFGNSCHARAEGPDGEQTEVWLSVPDGVGLFDRVRCVGRFSPNGDDDWGRSNAAQGIVGRVKVVHLADDLRPDGPLGLVLAWRRTCLDRLDPADGDGRALLAGCVLGYRSGIRKRENAELFSRAGVSHLIAVSGSHLAVAAGLLSVILLRLRLRPGVRLILLQAILALFVLACGLPVSALRAWGMCGVAAGAELAGRRTYGVSSASVVATCMALFDPACSGQLSFLLSVTCVIALSLFSAYAGYLLGSLSQALVVILHLHHLRDRRLRSAVEGLRDVLAATLVAQLASMPLTVATFSEISLVAPLANLVLSFPFTLLIGLGLVSAVLSELPVPGELVLGACDFLSDCILTALRWISGLSFASVTVTGGKGMWGIVAAVGTGLLLWLWPRVNGRRLLGLVGMGAGVCLALLAGQLFLSPASLYVLDVGQGDAILVRDGPHAILVDTGVDDSCARDLSQMGVLHLDAVVLTHQHEDHVGGLDDLSLPLGCGRVYVAQGVSDDLSGDLSQTVKRLTGGPAQEISAGDILHAGGFSLRMVWPENEVDGKENEDSIEMVLDYDQGGKTMKGLLTGDAEEDQTQQVVRDADVGDIDFLKVGHHGSKVSIYPETARGLDPELSVASAGEGNKYGHPTQECIEVLEGAGSKFLCTKDVGTVTVRPGNDGILVSTER